MAEIYNTDYNKYIKIIGTAHFTKRSINEAYEAIETLKPTDVAVELDLKRFQQLNDYCINCSNRKNCKGICEFTGATEALGNVNANIWLIDMEEKAINYRIRSLMSPLERNLTKYPLFVTNENPARLWEMGYKEKVIDNSKKMIKELRKYYPSIWRVILDERNTLMAARLAWIISNNIDKKEKNKKTIAFLGAAHTEDVKKLLKDPMLIKHEIKKFNLSFSKPTLIKRIKVH